MGTQASQHRALRAQEEPRKGCEILLCFPSCKRYCGGHVAMSEWLHSGFSGFLPILPPFFGLMELCWEVYPGARNRPKKWGGWSPSEGGKVSLKHPGRRQRPTTLTSAHHTHWLPWAGVGGNCLCTEGCKPRSGWADGKGARFGKGLGEFWEEEHFCLNNRCEAG